MAFGKFMVFVPLLLLLSATSCLSECNYDTVFDQCIAGLTEGRRPSTVVNLDVLYDAFKDLAATCTRLKAFVSCYNTAMTPCSAKDTHPKKSMAEGIVQATNYLCTKKFEDFKKHGSCFINDATKTDLVPCTAFLKTQPDQKPSCDQIKSAVTCADPVLETRCKDIHEPLGHMIRDYLVNRSRMSATDVCKIDHKDHDHSATAVTKANAAVLTVLLATAAAMMP